MMVKEGQGHRSVLVGFYRYGTSSMPTNSPSFPDRHNQVRKWIIWSGAIESAALAHSHDESEVEGVRVGAN